MKPRLKPYNAIRTVCVMFCLLLMNHYATSQSVIQRPTQSQLIVRDLQICDAVTLERDILKAYNSSLIVQLNTHVQTIHTTQKERDKYMKRSTRRGKINLYLFGLAVVETLILVL
jgi:hypothetical protein